MWMQYSETQLVTSTAPKPWAVAYSVAIMCTSATKIAHSIVLTCQPAGACVQPQHHQATGSCCQDWSAAGARHQQCPGATFAAAEAPLGGCATPRAGLMTLLCLQDTLTGLLLAWAGPGAVSAASTAANRAHMARQLVESGLLQAVAYIAKPFARELQGIGKAQLTQLTSQIAEQLRAQPAAASSSSSSAALQQRQQPTA
ncbi:hypothetical protein COO60DRAFT_418625 [Scenedesmus sp. NREL 46B-D3]|nr:hypothetical protein COO60DRAFT_418625 [Scenedesmus sp. NREL 46B-D3]